MTLLMKNGLLAKLDKEFYTSDTKGNMEISEMHSMHILNALMRIRKDSVIVTDFEFQEQVVPTTLVSKMLTEISSRMAGNDKDTLEALELSMNKAEMLPYFYRLRGVAIADGEHFTVANLKG